MGGCSSSKARVASEDLLPFKIEEIDGDAKDDSTSAKEKGLYQVTFKSSLLLASRLAGRLCQSSLSGSVTNTVEIELRTFFLMLSVKRSYRVVHKFM